MKQLNISKETFDKALSNGIPEMIERLKMRKLRSKQLRKMVVDPFTSYERRQYAASELQRRAGKAVNIFKILLAILVLIAFYFLTTP